MILRYEILEMRLGMIGDCVALADPPSVARADYRRIRETIEAYYYIKNT